MKILLYTDNHYSENSSVIDWQGKKFSARIENQIQSLNWVEELAISKGCDSVICLGDFFDKPFLNDEEISGLRDIKWNNLPHYFLIGNHESTVVDLRYSATKILENDDNRFIVYKPTYIKKGEFYLLFIPYYLPNELKSIEEYAKEAGIENVDKDKIIILSHNDVYGTEFVSGINSTSGIKLSDIERNCQLFLNGHIHSKQKICKNGYNIGNLTGKNYTENSFTDNHCATLLTLEEGKATIEFIENPYAFNFYTLHLNSEEDLKIFDKIKSNSNVRVNCPLRLRDEVVKIIDNNSKIVSHRIIDIVDRSLNKSDDPGEMIEEITQESYMVKFRNFCLDKSENVDDLFREELEEILK